METSILQSLISGAFALATALGSVWLKHHLEQPRPAAEPSSASSPKSAASRRTFSVLRPALLLLVGFAAGAILRAYKSNTAGVVFLVLVVLAFLALVAVHRRDHAGIWPYQLDCLALWSAYGSGYLLVHGHVSTAHIGTVVAFWLGFAVIGGTIMWFTDKRRRRGLDSRSA